MQYLLSEEEYSNLHKQIIEAKLENTEIINKLCQMVADHMPITEYPGSKEDPRPWVCYKTEECNGEEWYCDNCPVQKYCKEEKRWSN